MRLKYITCVVDVAIAIISFLVLVLETYLVFFEPNTIYHVYELNIKNSWFVILINFSLSITSIKHLIKNNNSSLKLYLFFIIGYSVAVIMNWYFLKTYTYEIYLGYLIFFLFAILIHKKPRLNFFIYSITFWVIIIWILVTNLDLFLLF